MKKYETIKNELTKALAEEQSKKELFADLKKTFTNEAIICEAMTNSELMQLLVCKELMKALKNKKYRLIHDSDFSKSKAQTVKYHMISMIDDANNRVQHIYADSKMIAISFSSDIDVCYKVEVAKQLKNAYEVKHKYESKSEKTIADIKDNYIKVHFDDVVNASKFALLILESKIEDLQAMLEAEQSKAQ
jgi:hypothetical protein